MGTFKSFEEIQAWQNARTLADKIYNLTLEGTFARDYKLRDQINGSSGSIMDNIAEGYERGGTREFIQFLSISKGSAGETRSQLYRAFDRKHISKEQFQELKEETLQISKQLSSLMKYLKGSGLKGTKYMEEPDIEYGEPET
ncbi:MAG: four helix bundle protein [Cyclobacteriaceae bacterium]|jgi:four helix bundle protein|nr:four helix bundle protein [Cyclobacteriaceae bacterium]